MKVVVMCARVDSAEGRPAATIDLVPVGGGSQTVTVDGSPEERVHPSSTVYHVRLLSPDRMIPDQLRETSSWDEAVSLAETYAGKFDVAARRLGEIAADLEV